MSFEVGDRVIDLRFGEGTVTEINHCALCNPVHVIFDTKSNHGEIWDDYTQEGFTDKRYNKYPLLYHVEGFTPPSCKEPERKPKCEFKPFDKVLVRDNKKQIWQPDIFAYLEPDAFAPFICVGNVWAECIPYEGNEDKCGRA